MDIKTQLRLDSLMDSHLHMRKGIAAKARTRWALEMSGPLASGALFGLYILIVLGATTIGATCGMGGGVIIKPLLDALSPLTSFQINTLSASCVLAMSVSSLAKRLSFGMKCERRTGLLVCIGALAGGVAGDYLFDLVRGAAQASLGTFADNCTKLIQNAVLVLLLVFVLIYMTRNETNAGGRAKHPAFIFAGCCLLGLISTFLGIGGGPINVCAFCLLLGAGTKDVAVYSLLTVFCSQVAKFGKLALTGGFQTNILFDANLSWWMLAVLTGTSVIGGLLGAWFGKRLRSGQVSKVFYSAVVFIILLDCYNIVRCAIALSTAGG